MSSTQDHEKPTREGTCANDANRHHSPVDRPPHVPEETVEHTWVVATDQRCTRCGYILRGLPVDGKCPECALDVALSIGEYDLASATPAWLRRMRRGLRLLLAASYLAGCGVASMLVIFLVALSHVVASPGPLFFIIACSPMLLAMLAPLPGMAGILFLAAPNPAEPEDSNVRRDARLALVWLGLCLVGAVLTASRTALSAYISPLMSLWIGGLFVFAGICLLIISSARIAASVMGPGAASVREKLNLTVRRTRLALILTPLWLVCSMWLPMRATGAGFGALLDTAATILGCFGVLLIFVVIYYVPAALISYAELLREVLKAVKAAIREQERRQMVAANGDA